MKQMRCPECGKSFEGVIVGFNIYVHRKWAHGVWWVKPVIVATFAISFVFGVGFIFLGSVMVKSVVLDAVNAVKSLSWPKVTGNVVASWVHFMAGEPGYGEYSGTVDTYWPKISYQYSVGGVNYQSDLVRFGLALMYYSEEAAKRLTATKYAGGKPVTVYYHPHKPEVSVLEPGIKPGIFLLMLLSLLVLGMGAGVIIGWLYATGLF